MELTIDMLLRKRDYDSQAFTKKIIEKFADRLTKAVQLQMKLERAIEWKSLELFPSIEGYVKIVGHVESRVGDIVTTANGELLLTEKNIHLYVNKLYFVLNSNILQNGTVEGILQHIEFVKTVSNSLPEDEAVETLKKVTSENVILDNPALSGVLEKITRPTTFESFDTTGLSTDQFNALKTFANLGKTEKPH